MGDAVGDLQQGGDCSSSCKREKQPTKCILCTLLLVGLLILILILYFSLFKPKDPRVQVPTMQLLSYSPLPSLAAASISLNLQVSMYNPNRGDFIIQEGSTACLYYQNQQVGFSPIPPSTIPAQSFSTCSISIASTSPIPLDDVPPPDNSGTAYGSAPSTYTGAGTDTVPSTAATSVLTITTSVTIMGHVSTANLFSHHSDVVSKCKAALSLGPPRAYIRSYTCQSSYSLDD